MNMMAPVPAANGPVKEWPLAARFARSGYRLALESALEQLAANAKP